MPRHKPLILLIDDAPEFRKIAEQILSDISDVVTAATAPEGLRILGERAFNLVVIDLMIDDVPAGYEILKFLRSTPKTRKTPAILVTGRDDEDVFKRAMQLGADDCFSKPFNWNLFTAKVENFITDKKSNLVLPAKTEKLKIFHVEDDPEWAALVRHWLKGEFETRCLPGPKELLCLLNVGEKLPDCLIVDLGLRDYDGLKLCDEIKARPAWQKIPIVVLTALSDKRLKALQHKALHVIVKSNDNQEELLSVLRTVQSQIEHTSGVLQLGELRLD